MPFKFFGDYLRYYSRTGIFFKILFWLFFFSLLCQWAGPLNKVISLTVADKFLDFALFLVLFLLSSGGLMWLEVNANKVEWGKLREDQRILLTKILVRIGFVLSIIILLFKNGPWILDKFIGKGV